jgi:hypothetical protein
MTNISLRFYTYITSEPTEEMRRFHSKALTKSAAHAVLHRFFHLVLQCKKISTQLAYEAQKKLNDEKETAIDLIVKYWQENPSEFKKFLKSDWGRQSVALFRPHQENINRERRKIFRIFSCENEDQLLEKMRERLNKYEHSAKDVKRKELDFEDLRLRKEELDTILSPVDLYNKNFAIKIIESTKEFFSHRKLEQLLSPSWHMAHRAMRKVAEKHNNNFDPLLSVEIPEDFDSVTSFVFKCIKEREQLERDILSHKKGLDSLRRDKSDLYSEYEQIFFAIRKYVQDNPASRKNKHIFHARNLLDKILQDPQNEPLILWSWQRLFAKMSYNQNKLSGEAIWTKIKELLTAQKHGLFFTRLSALSAQFYQDKTDQRLQSISDLSRQYYLHPDDSAVIKSSIENAKPFFERHYHLFSSRDLGRILLEPLPEFNWAEIERTSFTFSIDPTKPNIDKILKPKEAVPIDQPSSPAPVVE